MPSDPENIPCSFAQCRAFAFVRVRRLEGWADVCRTHYAELAQREAARWCAAQGLTSAEAQRGFVRRRLPRLQREPGED